MTIQELLKAQGLTDEQISKIVDAMKTNKIFTTNEENLDIRYGKLKTDHDNLNAQYAEAQNLIADFKKSAKGNEEMQSKITNYEAQIKTLNEELANAKLESAIKVGLLEAKATDIDYMTFKLKEKGELELDEQGNIKGWDDKLAGLKTQHPTHFESSQEKKYEERKLPEGKPEGPLTKEDILKMTYKQRDILQREKPDVYENAMKN